MPVPLSGIRCGLPAALSVTVSDPVRTPEVVGVKVTLMTQLLPGLSKAGQLLVWVKSPVTPIDPICNAESVLSISVNGAAGVAGWPTGWPAQVASPG